MYFMGITAISDAKTWETEVIQSPLPVFVDFWAEWCGPCRMVSPVVEELAQEYEGKVNFVKVNIDTDAVRDIVSKHNVFSIPTLTLFKNGEVVAQNVGAASKESYKTMIDNSLAA
jgi:thioredoxin 1